ncbi:MAG TPA: cupin domain-containing protein [Dermatophilaceae bacterium]|jgi:mannose-6-phosphate isomerase-like protein (cupin superfamily)
MTNGKSGLHVADGDGDAWWFLATRMRILADSALTGGALTLLLQDAPAGFGPPRHVHTDEDEAFFVLDGAMHIECGDQQWEAGPGSFTWLPRAVAHTFIVTRPGRVLQLTTPAGFESFVADVGTRASGPGLPPPTEPDIPRLASSAAKHGTTLVGPPLDPAAFGIQR